MVGCHEPSGGTGRDRVRPTTAACPFGSRLFLLVVSGIPGRPVLRGQLFACRFFAFCCDLANEAGTGKTGRHHWIVLRSKPTTPKNGPAHRGCSFPHISRDPRHLWVWHPRRPWNETSGGRCASPAPLKPCLPNVLMAIDTRRLSFPSVGETHHAKDITETPSDSLLIENTLFFASRHWRAVSLLCKMEHGRASSYETSADPGT
nr:uncharacterized protein LOC101788872 [Cavia porcellus]